MQIRLIAAGKLRETYVAAACAEFAKRLAPYYPLEIVEVKAASGGDPAAAMRDEGARILACAGSDTLWVLERAGSQLSSEELAAHLSAVVHGGARRLCLAVGGTFGLDAAVLERAQFTWSLSKLTFLHEWARMLVLEQLYRAAKIQRGEPYHH